MIDRKSISEERVLILAYDLLDKFFVKSVDGATTVTSGASEAIQVHLLILDHLLQYSGRKAVNGLGIGLIAFTDELKAAITNRTYTHQYTTRTQTALSSREFEVRSYWNYLMYDAFNYCLLHVRVFLCAYDLCISEMT